MPLNTFGYTITAQWIGALRGTGRDAAITVSDGATKGTVQFAVEDAGGTIDAGAELETYVSANVITTQARADKAFALAADHTARGVELPAPDDAVWVSGDEVQRELDKRGRRLVRSIALELLTEINALQAAAGQPQTTPGEFRDAVQARLNSS